jgi:hypothetical protein
MKVRSLICSILLVSAGLCLRGASANAQASDAAPAQQKPFVFSPADTVIYVSDFELQAENFQADEGRTRVVRRPGIIEGRARRK